MASRPPRGSKSDSPSSKSTAGARGRSTAGDMDAGSTIKDSSLQRREIPSYSDSREARIAEAAYWRAEQRGFAPGGELEDWLEAEKEVDTSSRSDREQDEQGQDRS